MTIFPRAYHFEPDGSRVIDGYRIGISEAGVYAVFEDIPQVVGEAREMLEHFGIDPERFLFGNGSRMFMIYTDDSCLWAKWDWWPKGFPWRTFNQRMAEYDIFDDEEDECTHEVFQMSRCVVCGISPWDGEDREPYLLDNPARLPKI